MPGTSCYHDLVHLKESRYRKRRSRCGHVEQDGDGMLRPRGARRLAHSTDAWLLLRIGQSGLRLLRIDHRHQQRFPEPTA